jgi:hypothetical protein
MKMDFTNDFPCNFFRRFVARGKFGICVDKAKEIEDVWV